MLLQETAMTVDVKYRSEAKATGGGRNRISGLVNGQKTVPMTSPNELGGSGPGRNPEELFDTGCAACYRGAMRLPRRARSWARFSRPQRSMPMSGSMGVQMAALA
jgi:organic hydroperoxide reductase OsmC/OhrA